MNLEIGAIISDPVNYFLQQFLPALINLDSSAIAIAGITVIVAFVLLIIVIKLFSWLLSFIKRFILFLIVLASLLAFFVRFQSELFIDPPNLFVLGIGTIGVIFAVVALIISLLSVKREWTKARPLKMGEIREDVKEAVETELQKELAKEAKAAPAITPTQLQSPAMLTRQALSPRKLLESFHDRSLLAVLSYMVVAQFGVFSGVTVSAPNELVGIIFFGLFLVAAFIFIKTTYHNYLTGIRHLIIALVVGGSLSILLGFIWAEIPIEQLLSLAYFQSTSLVALVTGLAVSLFMGSKG